MLGHNAFLPGLWGTHVAPESGTRKSGLWQCSLEKSVSRQGLAAAFLIWGPFEAPSHSGDLLSLVYREPGDSALPPLPLSSTSVRVWTDGRIHTCSSGSGTLSGAVGCAGGAAHSNLHKDRTSPCAVLVLGRPSKWTENSGFFESPRCCCNLVHKPPRQSQTAPR